MRYLLRYHLRLGDIIRCFPVAAHLRAQGHEVAFECLPQYHGIFELVDYVRPLAPGHGEKFDRVLDLQVWPERYDAYRASGRTWSEFIFALYPECEQVFDRRPRFSHVPALQFPEPVLVAPCGFSQIAQPDPQFIAEKIREITGHARAVYHVAPEMTSPGTWVAPSLPVLAAAIRSAPWFFTVDSAPNIIAAAVGRESWHYFPCPTPADGYSDDRQICIPWRDAAGRWFGAPSAA